MSHRSQVWLCALFVSGMLSAGRVCFAETPEPSPATSRTISRQGSERFDLVPTISMITPMSFDLAGDGRRFDYRDSFASLPCFQLTGGMLLGWVGNLELRSQLTLGYGSRGGNFPTVLADGTRSSSENAQFHWIPALASVRGMYLIPGFSAARPTLTVSAGTLYFAQKADSSALTRGVLMPVLGLAPAVTFAEPVAPDDWFGGVTLGTTFLFSVGSRHHVRSMGIDVGLNIIL